MRKLGLSFVLFAGETLSGKVALEVEKNHPGCWMADNLEEILSAKIKEEEADVDADNSNLSEIGVKKNVEGPANVRSVVKVLESILNFGSKLLRFAGDDFETSEAKCQRVTQAYEEALSVIDNKAGGYMGSLWSIVSLLNPINLLFELVRKSKLAGRFGDGGYMKIEGQLCTRAFWSEHEVFDERLAAVLDKFNEGLTAWQKQGKGVSIKTGGLKLFWERKIRDGFSWFLSKPSFTYPPGYLLALLLAVTSTASESAPGDEILRILGPMGSFSQKRFDRKEVVGRILDALENSISINPDKNAPVWLIDIKEQAPDLMKRILEMDIVMTNRRRKHKSVAAEVDTFEMGARVPGELFARFMMDKQFRLEKKRGVSEALKGLGQFSKFVFFSQTLPKSVEYSKEGRLSEDDVLVRNGGSYIFSLLDGLDGTGEVQRLIDLIRRKNSRRMAGKIAFRTLSVLAASCSLGLIGPLVFPASFAFVPWTLATRL